MFKDEPHERCLILISSKRLNEQDATAEVQKLIDFCYSNLSLNLTKLHVLMPFVTGKTNSNVFGLVYIRFNIRKTRITLKSCYYLTLWKFWRKKAACTLKKMPNMNVLELFLRVLRLNINDLIFKRYLKKEETDHSCARVVATIT